MHLSRICAPLPRRTVSLLRLRAGALRRQRFSSSRVPDVPAPVPTSPSAPSPTPDTAPAIPGIPASALAGLSPEYIAEFAARVEKGKTAPIAWNNPGAHGQLDRIPDDAILAMPPPRRPHYPMSDGFMTWRYLRSFSLALAFVGLAAYLQAKSRLHGSARMEAEQRWPWLTRALVGAGLLEDLAARAASLDVPTIAFRLLRRYGDEGADGSSGIPTARAAALLSALLSGPAGVLSFEEVGESRPPEPLDGSQPLRPPQPAALSWLPFLSPTEPVPAPVSVTHAAELPPALARAFSAAGIDPASPRLSPADFERLVAEACAGVDRTFLLLALQERFAIASVSPETLSALGDLYDRVCASRRSSGAEFSTTQLAELLADASFPIDAEAVAAFLGDYCSGAAGTELVDYAKRSLAAAATSAPAAAPPATRVPVTRSEFVDLAALAVCTAQVPESRVREYLGVFYLMHLSGMREVAGVAGVGGGAGAGSV